MHDRGPRQLLATDFSRLGPGPVGRQLAFGIVRSDSRSWYRAFSTDCFATPIRVVLRCRIDAFHPPGDDSSGAYDGVTLMVGHRDGPNDFNTYLPVVQRQRDFTLWGHEDKHSDRPFKELGPRRPAPELAGSQAWHQADCIVDPDLLRDGADGNGYTSTIIGGGLDDSPLNVVGSIRPDTQVWRHVRVGVRADRVRAQWAVTVHEL